MEDRSNPALTPTAGRAAIHTLFTSGGLLFFGFAVLMAPELETQSSVGSLSLGAIAILSVISVIIWEKRMLIGGDLLKPLSILYIFGDVAGLLFGFAIWETPHNSTQQLLGLGVIVLATLNAMSLLAVGWVRSRQELNAWFEAT